MTLSLSSLSLHSLSSIQSNSILFLSFLFVPPPPAYFFLVAGKTKQTEVKERNHYNNNNNKKKKKEEEGEMNGSSCSKVFPTRQHTLSLYRRIMKLGSTWKANIPSNTAKERAYIRNEARAMFHENKELDDVDSIEHLVRRPGGNVG